MLPSNPIHYRGISPLKKIHGSSFDLSSVSSSLSVPPTHPSIYTLTQVSAQTTLNDYKLVTLSTDHYKVFVEGSIQLIFQYIDSSTHSALSSIIHLHPFNTYLTLDKKYSDTLMSPSFYVEDIYANLISDTVIYFHILLLTCLPYPSKQYF